MPKIIVLGIGNEILTDEGIGIHAVRALEKESLPENVELMAGGTAGIEMLPVIESAARLIVVDAIDAGAEPGAIFRFAPEEVNVIPAEYHLSAHQIGLTEMLYLAGEMNKLPETVIFGVQPQKNDWGLELTAEVAGKIPRIIELVKEEIHRTFL